MASKRITPTAHSPGSTNPPTGELPLLEQIQADIASGSVELPVLPEVYLKVRQRVENDAPVQQIVELIEHEPVLTTAILRYARSIAFAGLDEVTDLDQAVSRLGTVATEHVVLAASARNVFTSNDPHDEALLHVMWDHSIAVAAGARRVAATMSDRPSLEMVFVGGLLHDIGKLVVLRTVAAIKKRHPERHLSESTLLALFDSLHCAVGAQLLESWDLPSGIVEIVRRHHDPLSGDDPPGVLAVAFADRMAVRLGASLTPDTALELHTLPLAQILGLDQERIEALLAAVSEEMQDAHSAL